MFKLVKIYNSRNNCPEFVKFSTYDSDVLLKNCTVVSRNGGTVTVVDGVPTFVIVGDYDKSVDKELVAYAITSDMVFRTKLRGPADNLAIGARIDYSINEENNETYDAVFLDEEGHGRIVDINKISEDCILVDVCFDGR